MHSDNFWMPVLQAQVLCGLTPLSVSGGQEHLMQHKASLGRQLHLAVCPQPWGQETKNKQAIAGNIFKEVPKIHDIHSWLLVRWNYCLDPGFPKHSPAITQTVGRIVFHLKLLCSHCFSTPTPDQGEIIYIYRLIFTLELCDSALMLLSDECCLCFSSSLTLPWSAPGFLWHRIVPSLFTQKCLENSYTFQWFLLSWKDFWDHSVQRMKKRKAHY